MKIDKLRLIFAATSVMFLLVLAISPLKDYFSDWRSIQKEFNETIEKMPVKVNPVNIGLQQIWSREFNSIDRCVTCHLGISNIKLKTAPQPFRTHSKVYHDIEKFGCTICHEGQGLATKYEDAHLPTEFWDQPVLPNRFIEASCGKCHIGENLSSTPTLNKGRELIEEFNCAACHDIPGIKKGYTLSLNGIGSKVVNRNWILRWLKNPKHYQENALMPDFILSEKEIISLTDFLMSFKSYGDGINLEPFPEVYQKNKESEEFIELGQTRFREARCISCHSVEGKGGKLAIDLSKVASKAKPEWIYNYIKNPKKFQPTIEMPQFGLSDNDVAAMTAYIKSEFVDWDNSDEETKAHTPLANFYDEGLRIFNTYNCGGCHTLSSKGITDNRGPDLSTIGSKKFYQIDWGKTEIQHTIFNYLETKVADPRVFGENNRMPQFSLKEDQVTAITTYLLSLKQTKLPASFIRKAGVQRVASIQGETGKIFQKYSCFKCHSLNNIGGRIAPDLKIVGSQLNSQWMKEYFKIPFSIRPIVEERMPNLFINEKEVEVLLNYFNTVFIDDSLEIPAELWKNQSLERGKSLFKEKYGCRGCHIVDGKGGYVGPSLDGSGDRLKPAYVFSWLMNPQKFKPNTIEPRTGMSAQEAVDITSYLSTFKKSGK
jgi:mono/diheme cytochrome c family protein